MRHVAAFFAGFYLVLRETFSDDATGKLSWQAFMAMVLVRELCLYVRRSELSDAAFCALIALIALLVYGPTQNLANYFKGVFGGFKIPDTQNNIQHNQPGAEGTQNGVPPVADINNPNPQP
jgi:hypothetical protein